MTPGLRRHCFLVTKRMLEGGVAPFLGAGANLCGRGDEPWRPGSAFLPSGT